MQGVAGPVSIARRGSVSVLRIDNPPVNAVSPDVVQGLITMLDVFEQDKESQGLVIACTGRTFVAGGDIASFEADDFSTAAYNGLLARLEAGERPVVAALFGTVLGGGLELALACHWRIATASTVLGLPEVKLGLLPGSSGTQRLPRVAGMPLALDLISTGRTLDAAAALQAGILDRVVEDIKDPADLETVAIAFLHEQRGTDVRDRRISRRAVADPEGAAHLLSDETSKVQASPYPAARAIVRALRASLGEFAAGEREEARLFEELRLSAESRAMRHLFFAQREASKLPEKGVAGAPRPIAKIAVIGAGTMGRGIAMNFLNAGLSTVLQDTTQAALATARRAIQDLYESSAKKGKLDPSAIPRRMELLATSVEDAALADCDLVVEAVYENLALKQEIFARLGRVCRPGAILATNTSTLDVDVIAEASGRPADVIGLHFFSPANVMRLLEIVRGARTSGDVVATAMQLARCIGKVAVVSGVCWGFIGNRMLEPYIRETERLILEGAAPADIDRVMEEFGMAMGPCRMMDLAGVDVGAKVVLERASAGALPPDPTYRILVRRLAEQGRLGQKSGAGYYRYEGRTAIADPEVIRLAEAMAAEHGIVRRHAIAKEEILERLLYPLINEGASILEEDIASRGSDIDVVWANGYGYPQTRGGPLHTADALGLGRIVTRLDHYARLQGNAFGYWTPSALLTALAADGTRISEWRKRA